MFGDGILIRGGWIRNARHSNPIADVDDDALHATKPMIRTMYRTKNTAHTITDTKAPLPALSAFLGWVSFQTSHNTNPTTGTKKPSTAHPNEPVSEGFGCCGYE